MKCYIQVKRGDRYNYCLSSWLIVTPRNYPGTCTLHNEIYNLHKHKCFIVLTDMLVIKTDRANCIEMYNLCSVLMTRMKMEVSNYCLLE